MCVCVCDVGEREKWCQLCILCVCVSWRRRGEKYGVRSSFIATPGHGGPSAAAFTGLKKEIYPLLLELVPERWLKRRVIEDVCAEHPLWMGTMKH